MTGCFKTLLSQVPSVFKTIGDPKDEKLKAIQAVLDGIKMSRHATQNLISIRKKLYYLVLAVNTRVYLSLLRKPTLISLGRY